MRYLATLLIGLPAALGAQPATRIPEAPAHAFVRSIDSTQQVAMEVRMSGRLFSALGVAPGSDGRLEGRVELMRDDGGTATTPAALNVSARAGMITFSAPASGPEVEVTVPGTSHRARGRVVRLVRDRANGPLRVETLPQAGR